MICHDRPNIADQRGDDADDIADDVREGRGEGLLRALDVTVQAGHERAGLGAGEEADRHPLDVVEHLGAQIVDQAFADTGRVPALGEADDRGHDGKAGDRGARAMTRPVRSCTMPWSMIAR